MSATFSNPPSPARLRPLAAAMVVAALGHVLFIEGLPRLGAKEPVDSLASEALETRLIPLPDQGTAEDAPISDMEPLPDPPAPVEVPEEAPAPEPAPEPAPALEPTPAPEPQAETAPPAEPPPAEPSRVDSTPSEAPADQPSTSNTSTPAPKPLRNHGDQATLIESANTTTFGGRGSPRPVFPALTSEETQTVLAKVGQSLDGRTKLARPTELTYDTQYQQQGKSIAGRTMLNWRHDGRYYQMRWVEMNVQVGNRSYNASGLVAPQGLVPVTGRSESTGRERTQFNHAEQTALISRENQPSRTVAFVPGTQDAIGAVLHLGGMLASQPEHFTLGSRIRIPVLQNQRVHQWVFSVEAEGTLPALDGKEVPVVHLVHEATAEATAVTPPAAGASAAASMPAAPSGMAPATPAASQPQGSQSAAVPPSGNDIQRIDLWLGPTLDYLPVQWRIQHANGQVSQHLLRSAVEQKVPPAPAQRPARDRTPDNKPSVAPPAKAPASAGSASGFQRFPESGGG